MKPLASSAVQPFCISPYSPNFVFTKSSSDSTPTVEKEHGFEADFTKLKYSYNVGLWGTSICGGEILDSAQGLPESAYLKQVEKTGSEQLRIEFKNGEVHAVNGEVFEDKIAAIQKIEEIGAAYGIGRDMHVGDTIIGIKGRVGFEAAAPMLIIGAHRFLEKYTLSKWQQYWKDQVANWYGMFLHESQYLEPVMRDIEAMLQESQRNVNGTAILELRPLSFSPYSPNFVFTKSSSYSTPTVEKDNGRSSRIAVPFTLR